MEFRKSSKSAIFNSVLKVLRDSWFPISPPRCLRSIWSMNFHCLREMADANFLRIDALRRNHQETLARTHISAKPVPATHLESVPDKSRRQIHRVCCKRNAIKYFLDCISLRIINKAQARAWFSAAQRLGNICHTRNFAQTLWICLRDWSDRFFGQFPETEYVRMYALANVSWWFWTTCTFVSRAGWTAVDHALDTDFLMISKGMLFRKDCTPGVLCKPYEFPFDIDRARFPNVSRELISPKCVP